MWRTRALCRDGSRIISLMLLLGFFLSCGLAHGQVTAEPTLAQIRPEIRAKLQALQREIVEKGYTFEVGYSPIMEYTIPQLCGLIEPKGWQRYARFEKMEAYLTELPASFDWRSPELGGNTPVRNQGSCGSCWAFGTVAPLEILISARCEKIEDLAEQYLVSCNEEGYGCGGGWFVHDYHDWYIPTTKNENDAGAVLETNFPYKASNVPCNGPHSHPYKIDSWAYVASSGVPSVNAIKQAIQTYGPVAVAVCVGNAFQGYKTGIFNTNESCSGTVNHAVTLVGWNDDVSPGNGYWILKNSWGPLWGESGYMRIRYGISKVGYAANYINFTNCGDIPPIPNLDCTNALPLTLGTPDQGETTLDDDSNVSTYGCSGRTESGPEKVYQVTTTSTGDLTATLSASSVDLDVFILSACDRLSCLAFGDTAATYANAPPGTYYLVVDGNNGAMGSFSLQATSVLGLPDLTGSWTALSSSSLGKRVYGTLKLSNIGSANAGAFYVAYYLSTDGITIGKLLKTQSVTSLQAGKDVYLYPQFTSSTSLSRKYIIAKIDYTSRIAEKNENNNMTAKKVP